MDCSPPGASVHGILQVRLLEWIAMPSSRGSSHPRKKKKKTSNDNSKGLRFPKLVDLNWTLQAQPGPPRTSVSGRDPQSASWPPGRFRCLTWEQEGRGIGRRVVPLSPGIHQEYTFRHRDAWRTAAKSGQGYLTSVKEYTEPRTTR